MEQWLDYTFGGHSCRLYFDGSMYVEELNALFVTDVHLGKGGQFRKEGIPTPIAVHRFGMKRLATAIDRHPNSTVIFLGDLFEGAQNKETSELLDFIKERSQRTFILVKGNHDFDLPKWSELHVFEEYSIGNFLCLHEPPGSDFSKDCSFSEAIARRAHPELNTSKVLICGHLHPGATLKGRGRFRVKMKAFYFNSWIGILPAFGALTGHYSLGENGTYFGLAENHVVALGNWEE